MPRLRLGIAPLAIILLCLVAAAGCKKRNPLFCCTSEVSCTASGIDEPITPCTDPERPYCDDTGPDGTGLFGHGRTCIADPMGAPCNTAEECAAERPVCLDHLCVQCEQASQCDASAPACSDTTHLCGACTEDSDCSAVADAPHCLVDEGTCAACVVNDDCGGDTPVCAAGACVQCAGTDDCGADTPVCLANQCVQCDGPDDCSAAAPVCGDGNACRGCLADAECASDACDEDAGGRCFDQADVIYISPRGKAGACTRDAPCASFEQAIGHVTGTRNVIKAAPGTYDGQVVIDDTAVTILADGATVTPPANQTAVSVVNGGDATIEGLTVTGVVGNGNTVAVTCDASRLTLSRSTVIGNTGGGGIELSACEFSLTNNIIANNGNVNSPFGGVQISNIAAEGLHEFEFNTVTRNVATPNSATGLACGFIAVPLPFSNNIIYGNLADGTGTQVGGDDDCTWNYSDIGEAVTGTDNINEDPAFVDVKNRDFHLGPRSPARNAADPAATLARDIDGDARPAGKGYDMGADEATE